MTNSYNKDNLSGDNLFELKDFEKERASRDTIEIFEIYYTDRSQLGKLTARESLFISFLDIMTDGRAYSYTEKVSDDIFLGKVGNRPVLIKLMKGNKVKDTKLIADELNKTASRLGREGRSIERTYLLHTDGKGMTKFDLISRPGLS